MRMHNPPHPGLVLREYLGDLAVSTAAAHLRVTRVTLSRVLNAKAGISAAMAIRLAAALGTTPELWMNMQSQYDLWRAKQARQPAVRDTLGLIRVDELVHQRPDPSEHPLLIARRAEFVHRFAF